MTALEAKESADMRRKRRCRTGFTLLEILIVAGLLALLAAFVLPQFLGRAEKAKVSLAQAAVGSSGPIAMAIDQFRLDLGRYPAELSELYEEPSDEAEAEKWGPDSYIKDPDTLNDPWGHPYEYRFPGEYHEKSYDLWSSGPDGESDTEDDIVNWKTDH
jgi:general secretion pathway protein G